MTIPAHPLCQLFPPMTDEEIDRLAEMIKRDGLQQPIVLYEGAILDGRCRLEACRRAGVMPVFTHWTGDSPVAWIIGQNIGRRHLTPSQRAVIALAILPHLEREARLRKGQARRRSAKSAHKCDIFPAAEGRVRGVSAKLAAQMVGVSARYVQAAKRLQKNAPELLRLVSQGLMNLREAQRAAKLPLRRQRRIPEFLPDFFRRGEELDMKRVIRQTIDPRPVLIGPDHPREHVVLISARQMEALKNGAAVPVRIEYTDCLIISRELAPAEIAARIVVRPTSATAARRPS